MPVASFCFEASTHVGEGHRIRSSALAESLCETFEIVWPDDGRVADLLVIDGYSFTRDWIEAQRSRASSILQFVDYPAGVLGADAVVQAIDGTPPAQYQALPHTRYLFGSRFRLLRSAFRNRAIPEQPRHGIWFAPGGTDAARISTRWVRWLLDNQSEPVRMALVSSASIETRSELNALSSEFPGRLQLMIDATEEQLVEAIDASRLAVCTASGVFWEAASRGVPVAVGVVADNQRSTYEMACSQYGAFSVGDMRSQAPDVLRPFLESPVAPSRIPTMCSDEEWQKWCLQLIRTPRLRLATMEDAERLYAWAMDPEVRRQSLQPEPFSFDRHLEWLRAKLSTEDARVFIAEWKATPCGMIRFDRLPDGVWRLSYMLSPAFRGKGLAHGLVDGGVRAMAGRAIVAEVRSGNEASLRVFRSAGWNEGNVDGIHQFHTHAA